MKDQNKNVFEPPERKHYKKRYLVRKAEEAEAEREIETYEEPQCPRYDKDEESE